VYFLDPNKISGALYHLVATYSVNIGAYPSFSDYEIDLANPKSHNLAKQSLFKSTFDGFKSL